MRHSATHLLARLDRWPRRLAALACLLLAAASALGARAQAAAHPQAQGATVPVVVAAHDLGVGSVLTSRDLTVLAWPRDLVPVGAWAKPDRLVGRQLAGPVRKREAVTTTRLVGAGLTAGLAPGEVAAPVATDPAVASLIHPGDHVDVLAGPPQDISFGTATGKSSAAGAILLAEAVAVLAVLPPTDTAGGSGTAVMLVATDRGTALRIAALHDRQVLAVLTSPP
jgi:pilus assembly protein CpaB